MANPFVHVELQTSDLAGARTFYSQLFDWELEDLPAPEDGIPYIMIKVGEGTGGGMMSIPVPGIAPHWQAYVAVDDIKASTEKARALGATIKQDVMSIGEHGWISVLADPAGAVFALWQANADA